MRGQVSTSNPAVLNPTGPGGRVDLVDKIINVATENLYTANERSGRYYGYLINGQGHSFPPVIPFRNWP